MKKFIAFILCIAVLAFVVMPQRSDAALAEGLLVGGAAVMTAALAVDTLIVAAGGAGMMDAIRKTAQNNNMTVSQFMSNEYADFRNSNGENLNASLTRFVNGFYFNPAGQLILSFELGNYISRFLNQIWSQDGGNVIENGTPVSGDYYYEDGVYYYLLNLDTPVGSSGTRFTDTRMLTSKSVFASNVKQNNVLYVRSYTEIGSSTWNLFIYPLNQSAIYGRQVVNGSYFGSFTDRYELENGWWRIAYSASFSGFDQFTVISENQPLLTPDSALAKINGNIDSYVENPDVYNLPQDKEDHSSVLDIPEVILPDSAADVGSGTINIGDYLQSLANALATDSTVDLTVTLENEATADIPLTLEQDIPVDVVAEDDVTVGDKEEVSTETDASALEPYMLNLTDFFPFCIPFDIYKMLNLFSASAQAPHFQWRIYAPNIVDYMIDIDLSDFDQAAQVLRTVELIAFAVALAFATKKIIQGGD